MENSTSPLQSSHSPPRLQESSRSNAQGRPQCNRPDLRDIDYLKLDVHRVDRLMKGLRPNEVFGGRGDERKIFKTMDLTSFDAVKVVGEPFASSVRSHTRRAIINTEWFACKTLWIPGEDDRNLYHKEVEYLRKLRRAGNWHIAQLI